MNGRHIIFDTIDRCRIIGNDLIDAGNDNHFRGAEEKSRHPIAEAVHIYKLAFHGKGIGGHQENVRKDTFPTHLILLLFTHFVKVAV